MTGPKNRAHSVNPCWEDVKSLFYDCETKPLIIGGRYGLGSKELVPADIIACFKNLKAEQPKKRFVLGIIDDVTNLSLPREEAIDVTPEGDYSVQVLLASVPTVQWAPTSRQWKLSATPLVCMPRLTSLMTPKSPEAIPYPTALWEKAH